MKRRTEKRTTRRKSAKAVGNVARGRKIAKAIRGTGIASRYVNRDNTLAIGDGRNTCRLG